MNHWQCQEPAGLHPVLPEDQLIHLERGWTTNKDGSWQLPYPAESHTQLTSGRGVWWEASSSPQQTWPSHGPLLEKQKDLARKGTLSVTDVPSWTTKVLIGTRQLRGDVGSPGGRRKRNFEHGVFGGLDPPTARKRSPKETNQLVKQSQCLSRPCLILSGW